ncbi:MAG: alpha-N-acetylglucosaminidase [Mediterranea sp.]|jgi:alpha-N-acetylglucosaminidase|nr:alpha-N-acetylglucosaminidase [Mediterranea sp.]
MRFLALLPLLFGVSLACRSQDTEPVDALAARVTEGTSRGNIEFVLGDEPDASGDFFQISSHEGKVRVEGNSYVALAAGLNWYLKYVAHVHISWNNLTQPLPQPLPLPRETIRHSTSMKDRYYLNYCTFSYSTAFWDWNRWEKEIDWMALHGVNMPLSVTGIEVVWYNLLKRVGYDSREIGDFIAGPAFMAWWQMNNLEGWGGPNPDSWYRRQEELQKRIVARMSQLGIQPVLPGYAGMVPRDIGRKLGYHIADPGRWCGFPRPAFLSPDDEHFAPFAAMYYEELEKLYGKSRYYSMDPFHEGGNSAGVDLGKAGKAIMAAMKRANPEATWVIQAWQGNPRPALTNALDAGDLLVLDLYSDKNPQWGDKNSPWYREGGFGKHDWLYCMLLNFGGNVGLHGRMNDVVNGYYDACEATAGRTLRGVGTTPEGIENNPVMFELLYELPWRPERFAADDWLDGYLEARYGGQVAPPVKEAWRALEHTVYNMPRSYPGQGTVESLLCARPGFHLTKTSTWGCSELFYSPDSTAKAAFLMASVADRYKGNNNFDYDLVDIFRQAGADRANVVLEAVSDSYDRKDKAAYDALSNEFLNLILQQDSLLATRPEFRVSTWLDAARDCGATPADKLLYVWNASALITVWGDSVAANQGGLHDYSHREWNGLLGGLYYQRWKAFFDWKRRELEGERGLKAPNFYEMERRWAEGGSSADHPYTPR